MSLFSQLETLVRYANATRYLSGIGFTVLLYDHILTLPSEIALIWTARSSYAKYTFLANRYLVPASLFAITMTMNHFWGEPFTDKTCRIILSSTAVLSVISVGLANTLVLLRVAHLWNNSRVVISLLTVGFLVSFVISASMMVASIVELASAFTYNPFMSMCVLTKSTYKLVAVWGSPLLFELLVLFATWWNALSTPRQAELPLRRALQQDGIAFYMALTVFRSINLGLASTRRPELVMMTIFFVWSMTTLTLNRSLLRLQRVENEQLLFNDMVAHRMRKFSDIPLGECAVDIKQPKLGSPMNSP